MPDAVAIDIHSHIFPGVDDGSPDMEESLRMAELACSGGSRIVVATPHFNPSDPYAVSFLSNKSMRKELSRFRKLLSERDIPLTIACGMELLCTEDAMDAVLDKRVVTLNKTDYLLVEFLFDSDPAFVIYMLKSLSEIGIIPVLAHPERYFFVQRDPQMIYDWVLSGCIMQCNRGSVLGGFGKAEQDTVMALLDRDLVHCIASDAHGSSSRIPYMADVYDFIENRYGKMRAKRLMFDNPGKILMNIPPELSHPIPFR